MVCVVTVWHFIQLSNKVLEPRNKANPIGMRVARGFWGNVLKFREFECERENIKEASSERENEQKLGKLGVLEI